MKWTEKALKYKDKYIDIDNIYDILKEDIELDSYALDMKEEKCFKKILIGLRNVILIGIGVQKLIKD